MWSFGLSGETFGQTEDKRVTVTTAVAATFTNAAVSSDICYAYVAVFLEAGSALNPLPWALLGGMGAQVVQ
jgi:hypothetical protein